MSMFTSVAPKMIDHKDHAYYSFLCGINIVETKVCSLSCKHCIYIYIYIYIYIHIYILAMTEYHTSSNLYIKSLILTAILRWFFDILSYFV